MNGVQSSECFLVDHHLKGRSRRQKPCAPSWFNHAGLVCGRGVRQNSTLVLQVGEGGGGGRDACFLTLENKSCNRNANERTYLGEEGSSVRKRMKSSGESLRHLEATGRNHLSLSKIRYFKMGT